MAQHHLAGTAGRAAAYPLLNKWKALLAEMRMEASGTSAATVPPPVAQDGKAVILAAIEQSKTSLLGHTDHLEEKCNLIQSELDKIGAGWRRPKPASLPQRVLLPLTPLPWRI